MMQKRQKKRLIKIVAGIFLYIAAYLLERTLPPSWNFMGTAVYTGAFFYVGFSTLKKAAGNIRKKDVFDENFLMSVATLGALAIGEFPEALAVMLFYEVGELFQGMAVDHSRKSIADLMDIRPDYANLYTREGDIRTVDPFDVKEGDHIQVKPGEKIPLDGSIVSGSAALDTSPLTGESRPVAVEAGDKVYSGSVCMDGVLKISVEKVFSESTVSKILELVENSAAKKSRAEQFITRFAKIYTPIVVYGAIFIALIPPLFLPGHPFFTWIYRALTFLVVSCPCALVISVPLSFFGGIGAASRLGILIKGGNYLEALSQASIAVFDKTGTLTEGKFTLREVTPAGLSRESLLESAALAEIHSSHPIGISIRRAYEETLEKAGKKALYDESRIGQVREEAGKGISAVLDGKGICIGNDRLLAGLGIDPPRTGEGRVHVLLDGLYGGSFLIADQMKKDAEQSVSALRRLGIKKIVMLTGDSRPAAGEAAEKLGIDEYYGGLLPQDKVEILEKLLEQRKGRESLIFTGDGINDAPVLARADVGIAMGGMGSDAAIEAADVVLMQDEPSKLAAAIALSRRTMAIAKQNIAFALLVKGTFLTLSVAGLTGMWFAVFADVGVTILAVFNFSQD